MKKLFLFGFILIALSGCAELLNLLKMSSVKKPTAAITDTKINGLSFSKVDLLFDVKIDNPNNVAIDLAGMDYDLKINNKALVTGNQKEPLSIMAMGNSNVQIPVSINYNDLYQAIRSLSNQDKSEYSFSGGLSFNLPVLGNVRIPISASGTIPLLKLPKVKVNKIALKSYSWSSASLELDMEIINNAGINLNLDKLNYGLNIAGNSWVDGTIADKISLNPNTEKTVKVPFKLNFVEMGRSLYDIVVGDAELNYSLEGSADVMLDHPLFKKETIEFEDLSKIKIFK
jgi:LEA14-like dessication related protein